VASFVRPRDDGCLTHRATCPISVLYRAIAESFVLPVSTTILPVSDCMSLSSIVSAVILSIMEVQSYVAAVYRLIALA